MSSELFLDYIRCNELSILDYEDILEEIAEYKDNISKIPNFTKLFWFLKSIKYSAFSLYNQILRDGKITKNTIKSLKKYLLRALSRSTPFGTLASVNFINLNIRQFMIDFDSSWVEKLLQEHFSMELTTVGNLNEVGIAHSSGLLWFSDEYYILDHLDIKYLEKKKSLDIILSLIDGKLSVSEIIEKMGKHPNLLSSKAEAIKILSELAKKNIIQLFMLGNQMPSTQADYVKHYLKIYHCEDNVESELSEALELISSFDVSKSLESQDDTFNKLVDVMQRICENTNYLHVVKFNSTKFSDDSLSLCRECARTMYGDFSELVRYSIFDDSLIIFNNSIVEKFGEQCMIPVFEVLLSGILDQLPQNIDRFSTKNNIFRLEIKKQLYLEIQESIIKSEKCDLKRSGFVKRVIQQLKNLGVQKDENEISSSDLIFDAVQHIDNTIELKRLSNQIGSTCAGKMIGRFIPDKTEENSEIRLKFVDFLQRKESLLSTVGFASAAVKFKAKDPVIGNLVNRTPELLPNHIYIDSHSDNKSNFIKLSDLFVYSNQGRTFLYSQKLRKRITITNYDMVNLDLTPMMNQLLELVTYNFSITDLLLFMKECFNEFSLPKDVYYGDIILFQKGIKIKDLDLELIEHNQDDYFAQLILKLDTFGILDNDKVILQTKDSGLLLDLKSDEYRNIIVESLRTSNEIIFEAPTCFDLSTDRKLEYIFGKYNPPSKINSYIPNLDSYITSQKPVGILNDEVIYYKIYLRREFENQFVFRKFAKFYKELCIPKDVKTFFVRYSEDGRDMIRIRLFGAKDKVLSCATSFSFFLSKLSFITAISINQYEREVARYGLTSIKEFECFQCIESDIIFDICGNVAPTHKNREAIAIVFAKTVIEETNKIAWLYDNFYKSEISRLYKKKLYYKIKESIRDWGSYEKIVGKTNLDRYRKSLLNYLCVLHNDKVDEDYVVSSLIHMLYNRLLGFGQEKEQEFHVLLANVMKSMEIAKGG